MRRQQVFIRLQSLQNFLQQCGAGEISRRIGFLFTSWLFRCGLRQQDLQPLCIGLQGCASDRAHGSLEEIGSMLFEPAGAYQQLWRFSGDGHTLESGAILQQHLVHNGVTD